VTGAVTDTVTDAVTDAVTGDEPTLSRRRDLP
jgi:hypothetical protein